MHWRKLLRGVSLFHKPGSSDGAYDETLETVLVLRARWNFQGACPRELADKLVWFVNHSRWKTRYPNDADSVSRLQKGLSEMGTQLQPLSQLTFEEADLSERLINGFTISETAEQALDKISRLQGKRHITAASKFLHLLAPRFFVMWDGAIRGGYGVTKVKKPYAKFLERVSHEAREALDSVKADHARDINSDKAAIAFLQKEGPCKMPLPKLLDEYNYMKFTKSRDELW